MSGDEETTPALEALSPSETKGVAVWTGETQAQDNPPLLQGGGDISTSFSQNPKQVLVASDSWCDSSRVSRRQHHPLHRERG